MTIDIGDPLPNFSVNTYDSAGVLADVTAMAVTLTLPDNTTKTSPADLTISHPSTGLYTTTWTATMDGLHKARWVGTGSNAAAHTQQWNVGESDLIVSLIDAQNHLRNVSADDAEEIRRLVAVASELCEQHTRVWRRTTVTGYFNGGRPFLKLRRPVISITSITVDGAAQTVSNYPLNAARGWLYGPGGSAWPATDPQDITVVYVVGPADGVVPDPISHSVLELTRHLFTYQRGGSGLPRQNGTDEFPDPRSGMTIPPHVWKLWTPYAAMKVG